MTDKKKFVTVDPDKNREFVDELFRKNKVLSWQTNVVNDWQLFLSIEYIESENVEITEDLCLVCMENKVDSDCGIKMSWKGGKEVRAETFMCMPCWDEIQNNHINIREAAERDEKMRGLDDFFRK